MTSGIIRGGLFLFVLATAFPAFAHDGLRGAIAERNAILSDIRSMNLERPALNALDRLLAITGEDLRARGHADLADQLGAEWRSGLQKGLFFPSLFGLKDLGDHRPLFTWLESAIERIEGVIPAPALAAIPGLADLRTMNFALAVVFQPRGMDGKTWDWLEYRKHFIPFLEITIYWSSYAVCKILSAKYAPPLERLCGPAADILKAVSARTFAAPLSDYVFYTANPEIERHGRGKSIEDLLLPIQTEEELLAAIEARR